MYGSANMSLPSSFSSLLSDCFQKSSATVPCLSFFHGLERTHFTTEKSMTITTNAPRPSPILTFEMSPILSLAPFAIHGNMSGCSLLVQDFRAMNGIPSLYRKRGLHRVFDSTPKHCTFTQATRSCCSGTTVPSIAVQFLHHTQQWRDHAADPVA